MDGALVEIGEDERKKDSLTEIGSHVRCLQDLDR